MGSKSVALSVEDVGSGDASEVPARDDGVSGVEHSSGGASWKLSWGLAVPVGLVLAYTGVIGKLIGDPYSVALFNKIGTAAFVPGGLAEPTGRYAVGLAELVALVLVVWPRTRAIGAVVAMGAMAGAIAAHVVTPIGLSGDLTIGGAQQVIGGVTVDASNPVLFPLALGVLVLSGALAWVHRGELRAIRDAVLQRVAGERSGG